MILRSLSSRHPMAQVPIASTKKTTHIPQACSRASSKSKSHHPSSKTSSRKSQHRRQNRNRKAMVLVQYYQPNRLLQRRKKTRQLKLFCHPSLLSSWQGTIKPKITVKPAPCCFPNAKKSASHSSPRTKVVFRTKKIKNLANQFKKQPPQTQKPQARAENYIITNPPTLLAV